MSTSYVYFIANKRRGLIKIGTSEDPRKRLGALSNGGIDVLHLVAVIPGDERYESTLHDRFAAHNVAGEWFKHEGELASFLELLPSVNIDVEAPRFRQRVKPSLTAEQKAAIAKQHREWLTAVRNAVYALGVGNFAEVVGADRGDVIRALNENGRYFRHDWWLALQELTADAMSPACGVDLARKALETP